MASDTSSPGLSVHITVVIAEENIPKFFEVFRQAFEKVTAEPECTFFEVYQSLENPGEVSWVENWSASLEWLMEVQTKKAYYEPYVRATEAMLLKPRVVKVSRRVGAPFVKVKKENGGF
ncbi:putative quinol monooxygenase [Aspergillus lucknowensis]|uniref:ABM domain-containing protein n=1 Tax=Aspergillus lucknowensis TaxID=176173 RepID=A0ABR4LGI1_9EURO